MALKTYNPTSPSMRQLVTVDRSELHKGKPVKKLTEGLHSSGGRNNHGRITDPVPRRRPQAHLSAGRLQAPRKWGVVGDRRAARVRPEPHGVHRAGQVRGRRAGLHPGAAAAAGRRQGDRRRPRRREARQRGAAEEHSGRHDHPQCRAQARRRRPDRALGRRLRAADRPRRRLEPDPSGLGRDPQGPLRVHGVDRRRLQPGPPEHQLRQGRPDALEGPPPAQSRRDHEPGRPSARRRRGPHLGWPASGEPVGPADQGPQDQAQQEDRPA